LMCSPHPYSYHHFCRSRQPSLEPQDINLILNLLSEYAKTCIAAALEHKKSATFNGGHLILQPKIKKITIIKDQKMGGIRF